MVFGTAQLGKAVKGRSQLQSTTTSTHTTLQQLTEQQLNNDIQTIQSTESATSLIEYNYNRLNQLIQNELHYDTINQNMLQTIYNNIQRSNKVESLHHELQSQYDLYLHQSHIVNDQIQTLHTTLQQYHSQLYQNNIQYLNQLKLLQDIQDDKLQSLQTQFQSELSHLIDVCNRESDELISAHTAAVQYSTIQINTIEQQYNTRLNDLQVTYETEREEVRNRNLESINELRINLESTIDELEKTFIHTYNIYMDSTAHYHTQYNKLKQDDTAINTQISDKKQQIDRLSGSVTDIKSRLQQCTVQYTEQNNKLQQQKQLILQYCNTLKHKINILQQQSNSSIADLVEQSRLTIQCNTNKLQLANKLITLYQLNQRYETEREQLYVVDGSTIEQSSDNIDEKYNELSKFNAKYNKVILDTIAIKHEKQRLLTENNQLKQQLQSRLNSDSIIDSTVRLDKTLLSVNGRPADSSLAQTQRQIQYNTVNVQLNGM